MLDVTQDSMKYSETFTEDVKELQMCCARYLRPKFQDVSSLIQFQKDNKDRKDVVHQLLILGSKSLKVFILPALVLLCVQLLREDGNFLITLSFM